MNILITGGAGFIGSNMANALVAKSHKVTVLDNLSEQIHGTNPKTESPLFNSLNKEIRFIEGTVTSKEDLAKALIDQEVVVHLAAETGTGQSMYEIHKYNDVNIGGTSLLLDLIVNGDYPLKKVIIASSRSIYGEGKYFDEKLGFVYPEHRNTKDMEAGNFEVTVTGASGALKLLPTDENSKIHPSSVYGITKQAQEQLVMTTCQSIGIAGVAFRYQNVYGPGQSLKNPYTGILSIFSNLIKAGKELNIFEDGLESRDFVYIDDVVEATIRGIEMNEADGQIFNVGTGVATSVIEVAQTLIKLYEKEISTKVSGNFRKGDIRHNYADLGKIEQALKWKPKFSFEQGIANFVMWVNGQSLEESNYEKSLSEMKAKGLFK